MLDLSRALSHGRTEKARITAAASLSRLRDPRAVKPLVGALDDSSNVVRALAATGLGYLGDSAALPALERARADGDRTVRRRATEAIREITDGRTTAGAAARQRRHPTLGGGTAAPTAALIPGRSADRLTSYSFVPNEPRNPLQQQLYIQLKSAQDKSRGRAGTKARRLRASQMRSLMVDSLQQDAKVTMVADSARADAVDAPPSSYALDVTIVKLGRVERGTYVEVECQIRVAVSTRRGKMLSFLTGGAKVQVPRSLFRLQSEPQLRREALESAVKSVHHDLVAYLASEPG